MGTGCSRPKSSIRSKLFHKPEKSIKSTSIPSQPFPVQSHMESRIYELISQLAKESAVVNIVAADFVEIEQVDRLLQEIESAQVSPFPLDRELTREQAIPNFLKWCQQNSVTYDGIELKLKADVGLGLFATRDLSADEHVLNVPKELMINSVDCNSKLGYLIPEGHLDTWKMLPMALQLIIDRKARTCDYLPYLDVMPHDFVHPHFFQSADFQMLRGSLVYQRCLARWLWLANKYCIIYMHVVDLIEQGYQLPITTEDLTFDAFRWAFSISSTRTVITQCNEARTEGSTSLVPLWDMCNNGTQTVKTYTQNEGDSSAWTLKPHKAGEQLFIEYNREANTKTYFALWGICCPNDILNPVTMTIRENAPYYEQKIRTLQDLKFGTTRSLTLRKYGEIPLSYDDLKFLIIMNLGPNDIKWPSESSLEPETWQKTVLSLSGHLDKLLQDYHVKLNDCRILLKENASIKNPRPRTSLVLTQLIKEQEIITSARDKLSSLTYKPASEITKLFAFGANEVGIATDTHGIECAA